MHLEDPKFKAPSPFVASTYKNFAPCPKCRRVKGIKICNDNPIICVNKVYTKNESGEWLRVMPNWPGGYGLGIEAAKKLVSLGMCSKIRLRML